MSMELVIQYVIIGIVVVLSALVVLRKLAPQMTNRWLAAASIRLARPERARFAHALSRRLQPRQATGSCADGCAACGACGSTKPAAARPATANAMPLHFRPHTVSQDAPLHSPMSATSMASPKTLATSTQT